MNADLRKRIESLDLLAEPDQAITDTYLWTPDCPVNVKLRYGDLKFKRIIETDGDLECWIEDEGEMHPFPLSPAVVQELEKALAIILPEHPSTPLARDELLALLSSATPPVQTIVVEKRRALYALPICDPAPVIVEMTAIRSPVRTTTVALEHRNRECVQSARDYLHVHDSGLTQINYLQALEAWSQAGP